MAETREMLVCVEGLRDLSERFKIGGKLEHIKQVTINSIEACDKGERCTVDTV